MATTPSVLVQTPKLVTCSAKTLAESVGLITSLPPVYSFTEDPYQPADPNDPQYSVPTIDFSLLSTSASPHDHNQRSKIIQDLRKACQEWGCFTLINHGVPESLMEAMIEACYRFFNLTEDDKSNIETIYGANRAQIKYGTSYSVGSEKVRLWRDFIKIRVHPEFHSLNNPTGFSEVAMQYSKRTREVATELVRAISESLGLEDNYMQKALNLERGVQFLLTNYYPPCPQPELAMGLSHHTDQCLVTLLADNGVTGGLQVEHNGKWVSVTSIRNAFFVILSDQMEIVTNGKYKSLVHQARVKKETERISIASLHGPSFDTVVTPSLELLEREGQEPLYRSINYGDYLDLQQRCRMDLKSALDEIRIFN